MRKVVKSLVWVCSLVLALSTAPAMGKIVPNRDVKKTTEWSLVKNVFFN